MNDVERIEEIQKAVRDLDMANYATWEALHWLEVARNVAIFYERGESEEAHRYLNEAADYSRRFEAHYRDY